VAADDRLSVALEEIRARGYENGAHGARAAYLSDAAAIDVPRLLAALGLLLENYAPYITRYERYLLVAILTGEERTDASA